MTKRILIADDEPSVRRLLEEILTHAGFEVRSAHNGDQLIRMAQEAVPDLVLIDLMMPGVDGFEAIRQLRNDTRTAHIPMIILTARATPRDVVQGFERGADDYITKPFDIGELVARVKNQLRRAAQRSVNNPLTGLPGNILITEELKHRIKNDDLFALMHVDLNNFKSFNDKYGFARGDRMIKLVAEVITETVQQQAVDDIFVGHVGGDDFVVIIPHQYYETFCQQVITTFDDRAKSLYNREDLEKGYLEGIDRHGVHRRFPLISIAIGVATNRFRAFDDHEDAARIAAEMKHHAKLKPESSYSVDSRVEMQEITEERRGRLTPTAMLVCADTIIIQVLTPWLEQAGLKVLHGRNVLEAHAVLAQNRLPALMVADGQLGAALWELLSADQNHLIPTLIFSTNVYDEASAMSHGARFLRYPSTQSEFAATIAALLQRKEA